MFYLVNTSHRRVTLKTLPWKVTCLAVNHFPTFERQRPGSEALIYLSVYPKTCHSKSVFERCSKNAFLWRLLLSKVAEYHTVPRFPKALNSSKILLYSMDFSILNCLSKSKCHCRQHSSQTGNLSPIYQNKVVRRLIRGSAQHVSVLALASTMLPFCETKHTDEDGSVTL